MSNNKDSDNAGALVINADDENEMELAIKNIYHSCDPNQTNSVETSKLIEFIKPYLVGDMSALNNLKEAMDPENKDASVSWNTFYSVMNDWTRKFGEKSSSSDGFESFNKSPSKLNKISPTELPYIQSTPRASFGKKLLNCSGLLSLSQNSSFVDRNLNGEEQIQKYENEIDKLKQQLNKIQIEHKLELVAAEEQNEILQLDIDQLKKQLKSEKSINEQITASLQQEKKELEELLRNEIDELKLQLHDLQKKLIAIEKENSEYSKSIEKLEQEKTALESKLEAANCRVEEANKEILNLRSDFELKEHECSSLQRHRDSLGKKLKDQEDVNDQLRNDYELILQQKGTLEKLLKGNLTLNNSPKLLAQYKSVVASVKSAHNSPVEASTACFRAFNSPRLLRQLSSPVSPTLDSPNCTNIPIEKNSSLRNRLLRSLSVKSSTPDNIKHKLNQSYPSCLDSSVSSLSPPIMYVIERSEIDNKLIRKSLDKNCAEELSQEVSKEQSSEEDLIGKMIDDGSNDKLAYLDEGESLQSEMNKTDVSLLMFVKNEQLAKQEEQIEKLINELTNFKDMKDSLTNNLDKCRKEIENKNMQIQELQKKIKQDSDWKKTIEEKLQNEIYDKAVKIEELKEKNIELTNSNNLLSDAIKNLQKEFPVDRLVFQCEDILNNVQFQVNERHSVTGQLVQLNKELKEKLINMEENIKSREKEIQDLKSIMEGEMETRNSLWDTIKDLENQLNGHKSMNKCLIDEQADAVEELIDTLEHESNKNQILSKEIELNSQKVQDLSSIETYLKMNLEAEKSANALKDQKIRQLWKEGDQKAAEITKLKGKISETENFVTKLQDTISEYKSEIENNKKDLEYLKIVEKQLIERENELVAKSSLICVKEKEISELKNHIQQLNSLNTSLNRTKETYVNELDFKDNFVDSLKAENAFLNESISNIMQKMRIEANSTNLKDSLCKLNESLNELIKKDKIRSREVDKMKKDIQTYMKMQMSYEGLKNTLGMTQMQLNNVLADRNSLSAKLQSLERDCDILRRNLKDTLDKNKSLENVNTKYQSDLQEAKEEIINIKLQLQNLDLNYTNKKSLIETLELENLELKEQLRDYDDLKQQFAYAKEYDDYKKQLDILRKILDANNSQLVLIKEKINVEHENLQRVTSDVANYTESLMFMKERLIRCVNIFKTFAKESNKFEDFLKLLPEDKEFEREDYTADVKEDFAEFEKLITLIIFIIESLITHNVFEKDMTKDQEDASLIESANSGRKDLKKFTLRMPQLSHPESPDSPSLEMNLKNNENCCRTLFNDGKSDDIVEVSETIFNSRVIPNQVAFPNLSDAFLEKVGLNETSAIDNLSKEEIESLFTRLAIQLSLDAKDTQERHNFQLGLLQQLQAEFADLAKKIAFRLRDHKCIGAQDSINGVFVLLENLKHLQKEIATSANQCGCLCYELRMMKCWELVTNYMAALRRDLKPALYPSIKSVPESETQVKKRSKNKKTETDSNKKESPKKPKRKWLSFIMKSMLVMSVFIAIALFGIIQINCSQLRGNSSFICPLDLFVKDIFIGEPPR